MLSKEHEKIGKMKYIELEIVKIWFLDFQTILDMFYLFVTEKIRYISNTIFWTHISKYHIYVFLLKINSVVIFYFMFYMG